MKNYKPLLSTSSIEGDSVKNSEGQDLGNIKDIMLNTETGEVEYAVLSFGGFMGMGDKLFALPWQTLSIDFDDECLVLNVEKETLENAPGFDKDNWPNMADPTFRDRIYSHYGYEASTRRAA